MGSRGEESSMVCLCSLIFLIRLRLCIECRLGLKILRGDSYCLVAIDVLILVA